MLASSLQITLIVICNFFLTHFCCIFPQGHQGSKCQAGKDVGGHRQGGAERQDPEDQEREGSSVA